LEGAAPILPYRKEPNAAGEARYPNGQNPVPTHVAGELVAGDARYYRSWYRDAGQFCTAATFSVSQRLQVNVAP